MYYINEQNAPVVLENYTNVWLWTEAGAMALTLRGTPNPRCTMTPSKYCDARVALRMIVLLRYVITTLYYRKWLVSGLEPETYC
jgi:hypothetical protein